MIEFQALPLHEISQMDLVTLAKAIEEDPPELVREELAAGRAVLWRFTTDTGGYGVLVTVSHEDYLFIWYIAGEKMINGLSYMQRTLDEYARSLGKTKIRAQCREGLLTTFGKLGYKPIRYVIEKEVPDGRRDN